MISKLITKVLGDPTEKKLKQYARDVEQIKSLETVLASELTSIELVQSKTHAFMARFEGLDYRDPDDYRRIKMILDEIKYEAFAVHKIACRLILGQSFVLADDHTVTWDMIPYDVQLQ